jgi:sugar phosphate isomerase/epimerase
MLKERLTIGLSCLHYEWQTLDEAFARAGELGLDVIEFSTSRLSGDDYARCAELAATAGIGLSLHTWISPAGPPPEVAVQELREALAQCVAMAATHLVVHMGAHPERALGLQRVAAACAAVADAYEQAGVALCLENHYPYDYHGLHELGGDPDDFLAVLEQVNSPAVRFCLDYGHSHMASNTEDFIARLAPWLAYTHIADSLGEHDDHLAAGDGTVDWPTVLRLTLQSGFRGPFTIEFPEQGDPTRFTRFLRLLEAAAD